MENSCGGIFINMTNKLNVVISTLNSQYVHSTLAPWCLLAGVKEYCLSEISATVIEGTINEDINGIAQKIIAVTPDVVGFSCYIWNITQTEKLIEIIKQDLPDIVVILGGPEVSYNQEEVLERIPLADYILSGEGERPFAQLLNTLASEGNITGVPALSYRSAGSVVVAEPFTHEIDPPSPYSDEYYDALKGRIAYLETSRGCPYSCAFCLSGRCGSVRFFDVDRAKSELIALSNSNTKTVKLVDRTFNANRSRAKDIFHFIIENYGTKIPDGVCFHFEVAADIIDDEMLNILAKAPQGSIQLEIGIQSFNQKTLEAIDRITDTDRVKAAVKRLTANGNIHIHVDLIAGLPYEDLESFAVSFDSAYELNADMLQLGFLKLLHGSPMRSNSAKYPCSYSEDPPYEVTSTQWISSAELDILRETADAVDRAHNRGRFKRTVKYALEYTELSPFYFFRKLGEFSLGKTTKISLDDYNALLHGYLLSLGCNPVVLRDKMVLDRLATNSSGKLPKVLKVMDPEFSRTVAALEREDPKTNKRGYALLYSRPVLAYAEYDAPDPVTGEYPINFYSQISTF